MYFWKNIYATREDIFNTVKSKDTIIFKNIDDLGKNFEEIKSNFDYLVVHGVILQFLEQPILNTLGKSAYKNLTERQKEIIGDFYIKKFLSKRLWLLQDLVGQQFIKLKKLLFPSDKKGFQKEVNDWINEKITLKQCIENTGFCRSYLYVLKRKFKVKKIQ